MSAKALASLSKIKHCYLFFPDNEVSFSRRGPLMLIGTDKVKIVRTKYKSQDSYIEGVL
ncbi:MAG: hypothetical protein WCS90_01790 [Bacilli bacterium]